MDSDGLIPREAKFVHEYLRDFNARRAMLRVVPRYGEGTAGVEGCRLLKKPALPGIVWVGMVASLREIRPMSSYQRDSLRAPVSLHLKSSHHQPTPAHRTEGNPSVSPPSTEGLSLAPKLRRPALLFDQGNFASPWNHPRTMLRK
jgi:hypothetical protein